MKHLFFHTSISIASIIITVNIQGMSYRNMEAQHAAELKDRQGKIEKDRQAIEREAVKQRQMRRSIITGKSDADTEAIVSNAQNTPADSKLFIRFIEDTLEWESQDDWAMVILAILGSLVPANEKDAIKLEALAQVLTDKLSAFRAVVISSLRENFPQPLINHQNCPLLAKCYLQLMHITQEKPQAKPDEETALQQPRLTTIAQGRAMLENVVRPPEVNVHAPWGRKEIEIQTNAIPLKDGRFATYITNTFTKFAAKDWPVVISVILTTLDKKTDVGVNKLETLAHILINKFESIDNDMATTLHESFPQSLINVPECPTLTDLYNLLKLKLNTAIKKL